MRAVVYDRYGPPEVQRLAEVERPVPKDDEVLIKIHATTVNRTDCGWRSAHPFFVRVFLGLRRPQRRILGGDVAIALVQRQAEHWEPVLQQAERDLALVFHRVAGIRHKAQPKPHDDEF